CARTSRCWRRPGQSTITGGRSSTKGQACASICWFAHSMRWVLITPFGDPVEPEVNRIFATDSGFTFANSLSIVETGLVFSHSATEVGLAPTAARADVYFCTSETNVSPR